MDVWQQIKEFFSAEMEKRVEKSDQELIDLAEDYKLMMNMPSWKHFENELKIMFELAKFRLETNDRKMDTDREYFELKMAQERVQSLREVMFVPFIAIGQGHHKEKERKQKGEVDDR